MFYQAAGFPFAGNKTKRHKCVKHPYPGFCPGNRRQFITGNTLFKGFYGRFLRSSCFSFSPADFGRFKSKYLFGFVYFLVLQNFQTVNLIHRQIREYPQTFTNFGIANIAKILIVIVSREFIFIYPNGIPLRFSHFFTRRIRNNRTGKPKQFRIITAPSEFCARNDVSPLVSSGNLGTAAVFLQQNTKIIPLKKHIVKFKKRHRLFTFKTTFYAVHRQHPVDGITGADIPQEFQIVNVFEPVIVVNHQRIIFAIAEFKEFHKRFLESLYIVRQRFFA